MPPSATLAQTGRVAFLHKRWPEIVQMKLGPLASLHTSPLKFPFFCRHVFLLLYFIAVQCQIFLALSSAVKVTADISVNTSGEKN